MSDPEIRGPHVHVNADEDVDPATLRALEEVARAIGRQREWSKDERLRLCRERALLILRIARETHTDARTRLSRIEGEAEHFYFIAVGEPSSEDATRPTGDGA